MEVKRGYKQTELGIYPEDWLDLTFKDICWVNQGLQIPISQRSIIPNNNSKVYITIQYLNDGKTIEYINEFVDSVCCNKEDILMTRTGNTGIVISGVEGVFHNNFFKINFNRNKIYKDFLLYYLNQTITKKIILNKAGTSTIPDLNHKDFYSIPIIFPPNLKEQTAIANALSDMDELISQTEKLIKKKKAIKQGAMQELLKPKEGWVTKKLGEIVSVIKSGGTPLTSNREYYNGEIPFLSISDMTNQGKYLTFTSSNISQKGLDNSSSWLVQKDSLIYSMYASVGFVSMNKIDIAISQAVLGMKFKEFLNLDFMYYTLVSMQKSILKFVGEGTQKNLNAASVKNFDITFPSIFEQNNISMILNDIDQDLNVTLHKLTKLKQQKQGMMQALLTGKIRLV